MKFPAMSVYAANKLDAFQQNLLMNSDSGTPSQQYVNGWLYGATMVGGFGGRPASEYFYAGALAGIAARADADEDAKRAGQPKPPPPPSAVSRPAKRGKTTVRPVFPLSDDS